MKKHAARQSRPEMINATQWPSGQLFDVAFQAGETCLAWNGEVLRFASGRLRQDAELGLALTKCRTWTEAAELQRDWATRTTEDYLDEGNRLLRIATNWTAVTAGAPADKV